MQNTVIHEIPAVWDGESRILMLGTMPSPASREAGFFYMHPRNRFWQVLPAVFGALAGMCTGLIHTKLKVNPILSGVLAQTALISVNVLIPLSFGEITSKSTSFAINQRFGGDTIFMMVQRLFSSGLIAGEGAAYVYQYYLQEYAR